MARETKEQEQVAEPLKGEDAERFVAYIENPTAPAGHNAYLKQADDAYADIQAKPVST